VDSSDLTEVRRTLWAAADQLRANSTLVPNEYRGRVLGLIFLAYAEHRFEQVRAEVEAKATARRPVTPDDYRARSVLFVLRRGPALLPREATRAGGPGRDLDLVVAFAGGRTHNIGDTNGSAREAVAHGS
jgi:hypothetical protein